MSSSDREVQDALEQGGDAATAFLWRRLCRDLDGELRIGVAGRDEALVARALRQLRPVEGARWVVLRLGADPEEEAPSLGAQDELLGTHALLWVTPASAPLGAGERAAMDAAVAAGAPERRAVFLGDPELLARMSDDPEREAAEVAERARSLLGADWEILREEGAWLDALRSDRRGLARSRREAVARVLLGDALWRATEAERAAEVELGRVDALLRSEEDALEAERREGRRVAAHLLGAVRRQTERLLLDLRSFLRSLEADLPAQIEGVPDLETVRTALPHWLHHVVEQWMGERLARWRAELGVDLAELDLRDADLDRAELLVPALHGRPLFRESGWTTRLGVTAAVGGGAALLAFGLWVPGLLALTGGFAWSALGRSAADVSHRRSLTDAAVDAVRQMGADAEHLLRDQLTALEAALERLGDERAEDRARLRDAERRALQVERAGREQRRAALGAQRASLEERWVHLGAAWARPPRGRA